MTRGRVAAGLGTAGALTVAGGARESARAVAAQWLRVLLSALGLCQLLMAAAAPPWLTVIGAVSGVALVLAAWLPARTGLLVALVLLGTAPLAIVGWFALVPPLVAVVALPIAAAVSAIPAHSNLSTRKGRTTMKNSHDHRRDRRRRTHRTAARRRPRAGRRGRDRAGTARHRVQPDQGVRRPRPHAGAPRRAGPGRRGRRRGAPGRPAEPLRPHPDRPVHACRRGSRTS